MIRLTALELQNFRSFLEPAQIVFPATGLVQVRGNGSGTGKSSLFLALADALGVSGVPATALKSWFGDSPRRVKASFSTGETSFSIERGAEVKLEVDGVPAAGSVAALNEHLRSLLKLEDMDWIVPLTYRAQGAGSFFLGLSDVEKKEFLGKVLGLDAFERAQAISDVELEKARRETAAADTELAKAKEFLEGLRAQVLPPPPSPPSVSLTSLQERLKEAQGRLAVARSRPLPTTPLPPAPDLPEDALLSALEAKMQQVEAARAGELAAWKDAHSKWREDMAAHQAQKTAIADIERSWQQAKDKVDAITAHLRVCLEKRCPTCAQDLPDEELAEQTRAKLKAAVEAQEALAERHRTATAALKPAPAAPVLPEEDLKLKGALRARIDARRKQVDGQNAAVIDQWKDACAEIKAQALEASAARSLEVSRLQSEVSEIEYEIRTVKSVCDQIDSHAARQAAHEEALRKAEARVQRAVEEQAAAGVRLAAEEDFALLIGPKGFMGAIFDETLLLISMEANGIFARLPNVAHVSLSWQSGKGKRKAITPVFRAHGVEIGDSWRRVFSGGQVAAIELAIDLAVARVISRRVGAELGWLILDEPFVGLPAGEVEQIMAGLEEIAQDRLVLCVHHDAVAQEMFKATLRVQCEGGRSTVEWA